MPRWPALARWARRPSPLLADGALALVLAGLSLLTIETQRPASGPPPDDTEILIQPVPVTPGDPVEITVRKGGKPFRVPNVEPLLTIQNVTTGRWKTYVAKTTERPGVYRTPAVQPGKGTYSYSVLYGPFEQNVTVRGPSDSPAFEVDHAPQSDSSPIWPVALTLLASLPIALRRRFPWPVFLATLPAGLAMAVLYDNFQFAGALVALYTIAAYVGRPGSVGVGVGTALALSVTQFDGFSLVEGIAIYVIFAVAWILPVSGNQPTRRRTAANPLNLDEYMTHLAGLR